MSDNYEAPPVNQPVLATRNSWCATCPELISKGDPIVKCAAGWQCAFCAEEGKGQ